MFEAYTVYILLLVFMLFTTWIYAQMPKSYQSYILMLVVFVYSIVLGLRYNVGVDYMIYKDIYLYQDYENIEPGYAFLNKLLYNIGFSYPSIFIICAFLQIFFFLKAIDYYDKKIIPLAVYLFFSTLYIFLSLNVIRQTLAFSIFLYSIRFVVNRQLFQYLLTMTFAFTIHKSAIVLYPLYFIILNDYLIKRPIVQIIIYVVFLISAQLFSDLLWNNFSILASILGYSSYGDFVDMYKDVSWKSDGIGVYLWMMIDVWIMSSFVKSLNHSPDNQEIVYYNLYYIGLILTIIVSGTYLERINIYFQNVRIIIYAIFIYNNLRHRSTIMNKIASCAVIAVLFLFFILGIKNGASNCAPFEFVNFSYAY